MYRGLLRTVGEKGAFRMEKRKSGFFEKVFTPIPPKGKPVVPSNLIIAHNPKLRYNTDDTYK